tara:strand:+ start:488 stop:997 length:510 start_codon:yes stop_codon:yes gene_type:complete
MKKSQFTKITKQLNKAMEDNIGKSNFREIDASELRLPEDTTFKWDAKRKGLNFNMEINYCQTDEDNFTIDHLNNRSYKKHRVADRGIFLYFNERKNNDTISKTIYIKDTTNDRPHNYAGNNEEKFTLYYQVSLNGNLIADYKKDIYTDPEMQWPTLKLGQKLYNHIFRP